MLISAALASSGLLALHADPSGVPAVHHSARRLILLRPAATVAATETADALAEHFGADVRFVLASPTPASLGGAEHLAARLSPTVIGGLGVETSQGLAGEAAAREEALAVRDFVIRGTRDGSASVIVSDERGLHEILAEALGSEEAACVPDSSVSVLDFGPGSWPAVVADEPPTAQIIGFTPSRSS